jgi:SNF2 family DNA or RNA helicase
MVINGTVDTASRQYRVDTFQRTSGFDVMILSAKAGGVGLTLTAANHVIHLSRWWNPAVEDQCSDRVYRAPIVRGSGIDNKGRGT